VADRERRLVTTYRTPDLAAECERLRGELAAAQAQLHPRARWGWRDKLAAPIILSGYPIGTGVILAAHGGAWAYVAVIAAGYLWWGWALRYARGTR
jgi:hypothetical protein